MTAWPSGVNPVLAEDVGAARPLTVNLLMSLTRTSRGDGAPPRTSLST